MSEITVTEFETTEVEETKYECDRCGAVVDEDAISSVLIAEGDVDHLHAGSHNVVKRHYCAECVDGEAIVRAKREHYCRLIYVREWWSETKERLALGLFEVTLFVTGLAVMWWVFEVAPQEGYTGVMQAAVTGGIFGIVVTMVAGLFWMIVFDMFDIRL